MPSTVSTVIVCLIIIVIAFFSIISYIKKLSNGCCASSVDKVERIKPMNRRKGSYPYSKIVEIGGMSCKNCAIKVENAFNSLDGYYAKVDIKGNKVLILMMRPTDDDTIREIVKKSGYKLTAIHDNTNV